MRYKDLTEVPSEKPLKESDGATCAANVATVAQPFFGAMVEPQTAKKSKKKKPIVLKRT